MRDTGDFHPGLNSGITDQAWYQNEEGKREHCKGFSLHYGAKKFCPRNPELNPVVVTCITHHTTIWQTPKKKKLILCHVTSDMPVTLVTPGKPRKFKIQVQSSKSRIAVWGLRQRPAQNYVPFSTFDSDP